MWTSTPLPWMARPVNGMRALPQHAQHIVGNALQPLLAHGGGIDLEQQARAALEIKAEHDVTLRPRRPCRARSLSEKKFGTANRHTTSAMSRIPAAFHRVKNNMKRLSSLRSRLASRSEFEVGKRAPRQVSLRRLPSPARPWRALRDTIERICRTRTPSEISTSIWSSSTTLVTLPTRPPLVTTVSPRRSALTMA